MKAAKLSSHLVKVLYSAQANDDNCGPTTTQMLLGHRKIKVTQEQVIAAANIQKRIHKYGMRPDMIATAVQELAPNVRMWFKDHANVSDIATLIEEYHCPVAVNWQGLFYASVREEKKKNKHEDTGHYSIIIDIDRAHSKIMMLDPYKDFAAAPRVFSYRWFVTRWWDFVTEMNKKTGVIKRIDTRRFLFVIAPKSATFPKKMGLHPSDELYTFFSMK